MTEFRIEEGNFTILPNEIFKHEDQSGKRLRPEVIGIYALMLSLPDYWDYTVSGMMSITGVGRDKLNGILIDLEKAGYLTREQTRDEFGRLGKMSYKVHRKKIETPFTDLPFTAEPITAEPFTDNLQQVSTKEVSTNVVSTKRDIVENVITYLNQVAGTNFRNNTKSTIGFINGRINDGYTLQDFKNVIDVKSKEWLNTDMQKYLRPATLFNPTKFEAYVNETSNKHNQIDGKLEDHMLELNKGGDLF